MSLIISEETCAFEPGSHACYIYGDRDRQLEAMSDSVIDSVRLQECCVYIATVDDVKEVRRHFVRKGIRLRDGNGRDAFQPVEMHPDSLRELNPGRSLSSIQQKIQQSRQQGFSRVRVISHIHPQSVPSDPHRDFELMLNDYVAEERLTWICHYDQKELAAETAEALVRAHPVCLIGRYKCVSNPYWATSEPSRLDVDQMLRRLSHEWKRAQEYRKLSAMVRAVHRIDEAILAQTPDGDIIYANDAALDLFDCASLDKLEEALRTQAIRIADKHGRELPFRTDRPLGDLFEKGGRFIRLTKPQGTTRLVHAATETAYDRHGQEELHVSIFRDVTAETRISELLHRERRLRAKAEHQSQVKNQFIRYVAHEIRGGLTSSIGWCSLLRLGKIESITPSRLQIIERNLLTIAKLIEDVTDFSRIETGKLRLDRVDTDTRTLFREVSEYLHPFAEEKNIRTVFYRDPSIPSIHMDPVRFQQVMRNLLTNALKFTPANGTIDVRLERGHGGMRLSVQDSGIGIPRDVLPHIFDPFTQSESLTAAQSSGIGLGLFIVRKLVELHGWSIRVNSAGLNMGTVFEIRMPDRAGSDSLPA